MSTCSCGGLDENSWRVLAWALSIVGAVLALLLGPRTRSVRYWSYLSISFFILIICASIVSTIISLIPFIGGLLSTMIWAIVVIIWVIGVVKAANGEDWKPPVIYEVSRLLERQVE